MNQAHTDLIILALAVVVYVMPWHHSIFQHTPLHRFGKKMALGVIVFTLPTCLSLIKLYFFH